MKPTFHSIEMLRAEHVNILRACAEGEAMAQSLLRSENVPAEALSALTRFFVEYVAGVILYLWSLVTPRTGP